MTICLNLKSWKNLISLSLANITCASRPNHLCLVFDSLTALAKLIAIFLASSSVLAVHLPSTGSYPASPFFTSLPTPNPYMALWLHPYHFCSVSEKPIDGTLFPGSVSFFMPCFSKKSVFFFGFHSSKPRHPRRQTGTLERQPPHGRRAF